jgi:hypothetical protein
MTNERTSEGQHLDGNALGGLLFDIFGREMTPVVASCAACGSDHPFGALIAFTRAPGDVLCCTSCGAVLLVAVRVPGGVRVTFEALGSVDLPDE